MSKDLYWVGEGELAHNGEGIPFGGKLPKDMDPKTVARLFEKGKVADQPPGKLQTAAIVSAEAAFAKLEAERNKLSDELEAAEARIEKLKNRRKALEIENSGLAKRVAELEEAANKKAGAGKDDKK